MIGAFFRLILIAAATVLIFGAVGMFLRGVGEQQTYAPATQPLLLRDPLYVAWGGLTDEKAFTLPAYKAAAEKKFVLGVDLRLSSDGQWFVYPDKYLPDGTFLTHTSAADLAKKALSFDELFKTLPEADYYVVIENPAAPYLESIFKLIEGAHREEHFILSSPFYDTTKLVRERNPRWLTGSTTSEVAKAELLASLYLESLVTTTGDVMLLDKVNARLMGELRKRHLGVLLKSENSSQIKALLQQDLISGALTSRPSSLLQ